MVKVIILFRAGQHSAEYEAKYNDFLMSLEQLPKVRRKTVSNIYSSPTGLLPFHDIIELYFDSKAEMEFALTSSAGVDAGNMLVRFAGADAITLFAEVMEEDYPIS